MAAPEKKKKKWKLMLTLTIIICQYVAAHISGWINAMGTFDLMAFDQLFDYFTLHPLDVKSFNPLAYMLIYAGGFAVFFHMLFSRQPPKAEMKGVEHGSNRFMTAEEIVQFSADRSTPNFPYSRDVREPGVYPKKEGVRK